MSARNLTDSVVAADNRHVEQSNNAVTALALLIEKGRKQHLHGEVGVTVFFKEGTIQGFRHTFIGSEK